MKEKVQYRIIDINAIISLICLTIGGMLYVVFRPRNLIMFSWFKAMGLEQYVDILREGAANLPRNSFMIYNLPAGLWLLSYLCAIMSLKLGSGLLFKTLLWSMPLGVILSEIFQFTKILPGTFDIIDLLTYIGFVIIFISINPNYKYKILHQ